MEQVQRRADLLMTKEAGRKVADSCRVPWIRAEVHRGRRSTAGWTSGELQRLKQVEDKTDPPAAFGLHARAVEGGIRRRTTTYQQLN